jgi:hypothetical protein
MDGARIVVDGEWDDNRLRAGIVDLLIDFALCLEILSLALICFLIRLMWA